MSFDNRLFRRRRRRSKSPETNLHREAPFRLGLRPTPSGLRFLLLIGVMEFAAYNTRNNLLYLMFSVGLATTVVSLVAGRRCLSHVEIEPEQSDDIYAGSVSIGRFRARNASRFNEAFGLELEALDYPGPRPTTRITRLSRREARSFTLERIYPLRGRYESDRVSLSTVYPFGLFRSQRVVRLSRELTVFPRIEKVDLSFVFRERAGKLPLSRRRGNSEDLLRVKEYAPGDNLHYIHWKASAKLGRFMVREFSSEVRRRFTIVFDNRVTDHEGAEAFEGRVSTAASLAVHLFDHGLIFCLISAEEIFPHDRSREHLRGVLSYLSTVRVARKEWWM